MGLAPIPIEQQYSDEQKQSIREQYAAGKTQAELATQFGIPRRSMMKLCVRLGLHKTHKEAQKSKFADGFVEQIARLRGEGKTLQEIAGITQRSTSAIHRATQRAGVDKPTTIFDEKSICERYVSGDNLRKIAKSNNTSVYFIKMILLRNKINLRKSVASGGSKIKIVDIDLPPFVDNADWFAEAYVKYGMASIAKFVGRSVGYVGHKLRRYGIQLKTISERGLMLDRPSVINAYQELGSMQKVAKRFNCTNQAIRNILSDGHVVLRTASEILSGPGNPFFGKQHSDETRALCARIGAYHGAKFWEDHPEYIEIVKAKATEYWSDMQRRYEDAKRISKLRAEGKCGTRRGKIVSRFGELSYDSSYEMRFIEFCEADSRIVFLERDFDVIEYEYDGSRCFVPDFRLWINNGDCIVVEIKSDWYSKQPKEQQKIAAGFAKFVDKFMVLSQQADFSEVTRRINHILSPHQFQFDDVVLQEIGPERYVPFYGCFHYLGKGGRRGFTMGAFLEGRLIAATTISSITRAEIAIKQGLSQSEMRELVRFCIHPEFHKRNFATWFLSRAVYSYKELHPSIKMLVAFADTTHGHVGTIYKAASWRFDGETGPSYHYLNADGNTVHKKTVYDQARRVNQPERDYAAAVGLARVASGSKLRFLLPL